MNSFNGSSPLALGVNSVYIYIYINTSEVKGKEYSSPTVASEIYSKSQGIKYFLVNCRAEMENLMYTAVAGMVQHKKFAELVHRAAEERKMRGNQNQFFEVKEEKLFYGKFLVPFQDDVDRVLEQILERREHAINMTTLREKWLHDTKVYWCFERCM